MAINSFEKIKQTSRAILFEEFDVEKKSLYDLLSMEDPLSDDFEEDIQTKLVVNNFEDFIKKFAPKVYEICTSIDGKPKFEYTTDVNLAKKYNGIAQDITEHVYYRMLEQLYIEKGSSGQSNLKFDDKDILEMLTPTQEVEDAKDIRKKLQLTLEKYNELKSKNENANEYAQQFIECRKKIQEKYSQSQMSLLPLAIEDMKTKIEYLDKNLNTQSSIEDNNSVLTTVGQLTFNNSGTLVVKEITVNNDEQGTEGENITSQNNINNKIRDVLALDYDSSNKKDNEFIKSIVLSSYAPININTNENKTLAEIKEEKNKCLALKNSYEEVYCQAKNAFINEMTTIIEKLLDVKVFFDHATVDGNKLENGILITNCKASKLIKGDIKDKFEKFIKDRGLTQIRNKIWFAILPAIEEKDKIVVESNKDIDPLDAMGPLDVQKDDETDISDKYLSFSAAKTVLELLDKSKIMTIFSFKGNKNNGFAALNANYITNKKEELNGINYEHAVYAYPNFTLTRERIVILDNKEIKVPGVYIDAAYPAAGLLIGSQQIKYLEKRGFKGKLNPNNVCVHVDLEEDRIRKNLLTKFNREVTLRWSQDLKTEINRDKFGFVFCSDEVYIDDMPMKNAYVYFARTMKKSSRGIYRPIYRVLTEDFIRQYLKSNSAIKESTMTKFENVECNEWQVEGKKNNSKDYVNLILRPDEKVEYDRENKKLKITFNDDEAILEDIDIDSEE